MITKITSKEYSKMIDTAVDGKYEPIGTFYLIDEKTKLFIGVDNSHGHCWVEEFKTLATCKKWLGGSR